MDLKLRDGDEWMEDLEGANWGREVFTQCDTAEVWQIQIRHTGYHVLHDEWHTVPLISMAQHTVTYWHLQRCHQKGKKYRKRVHMMAAVSTKIA